MDIYDIIIEPPYSTVNFIADKDFFSLIIFGVSLLITFLVIIYYRRFISLCTFNYITVLLKHEQITYKHFAYLIAKILCYKHKETSISKENPPIKSSKDKHYLWIALVDTLNDVRYGKDVSLNESYTKLHKTALEWLRYS